MLFIKCAVFCLISSSRIWPLVIASSKLEDIDARDIVLILNLKIDEINIIKPYCECNCAEPANKNLD